MSDVLGHTLVLPVDGAPVPSHPAQDVADCGFDEYAATWVNMPGRPATWEFIRRTDDETGTVDWLGTKQG